MFQSSHQHGLTLIELLIALSLATLLSTILFRTYLTSYNLWQLSDHLASLQEAGRITDRVLRNAIDHAGNLSCFQSSMIPIKSDPKAALAIYSSLPQAFHESAKNIQPDSDILLTQGATNVFSFSDIAMTQALAITLPTGVRFQPGDKVIVTDCQHIDIVQIVSVSRSHHLQKITFNQPLSFLYHAHAQVAKFEQKIFFVGKDNKLYEKQLGGQDTHKRVITANVRAFHFHRQGHYLLGDLQLVSEDRLLRKNWPISLVLH